MIDVDQHGERAVSGHHGFVSQRAPKVHPREWLSAEAAAALLGVKRPTLYSYASSGLVRSVGSPGTRDRLYHQDDLERLRARSQARAGHGAVAAGALRWGEPVLETAVGTIRPEGPIYRGQSALLLATEGARFEDVCALLWDAPFAAGRVLTDNPLGAPPAALRALLRRDAEPFDAMMLTAGALASSEPKAEPTTARVRERAPLLVRRLVASLGLVTSPEAVAASLEQGDTARALLVALGGRTTEASIGAVREALILSADHELNASTFSARVAASAHASLPACLLAALATLSGPLHGAATARVEALASAIGKPEKAAEEVRSRLERGEPVPGYGHPLYQNGDPRGRRLLDLAVEVGPRAKVVRTLSAVTSAMALAARDKPTLDVGLVAIAAALNLRRGAPLAIFATGRLAGWVAHVIEQREANYLLRPRARYVGA